MFLGTDIFPKPCYYFFNFKKKQYNSHVQFIPSMMISDYNKHYDDGNGKYKIRYILLAGGGTCTWNVDTQPVIQATANISLPHGMSIIFFHGLLSRFCRVFHFYNQSLKSKPLEAPSLVLPNYIFVLSLFF